MRAVLVIAVLVLVGCGRGADPDRSGAKRVPGAVAVAHRFGGIAQHGSVLGSPRAPYTMFEFADLQCPYCARFDRDVLPALIERFVRPGRLKLDLRPIAVIGPGSVPAGAAAIATGLQSRMWEFADLFYRNQQPENSGYVTRTFIDRIAGAVPGLDAARLGSDLASARARTALVDNERSARTARITGTPGFQVGPSGGVLSSFQGRLLERDDFVRRLGRALGPGPTP